MEEQLFSLAERQRVGSLSATEREREKKGGRETEPNDSGEMSGRQNGAKNEKERENRRETNRQGSQKG